MLNALTIMPPWFFVFFAFILGAIFGSFVNAAIYRLPRQISMLTKSRSFCPHCNYQLTWYDNIPILSYLILLGRCRGCKKRIPVRYLTVELLVASLFALTAWQYFVLNRPVQPGALSLMPGALLAVQLFLIANLICIAFSDLETWYIPIETTIPWIFLGLLLAPVFPELHASATQWTASVRINAFIDSFQGIVLGGGILWLIGFFCIVALKKLGMGGGDIHLVAMVGALLGWKPALATLFIGVFIGTFIGISSILYNKIQKRLKGKDWKPRQAAFELPEDSEDMKPPDPLPLLIMGLIVVAFEVVLLVMGPMGSAPIPVPYPPSEQSVYQLIYGNDFANVNAYVLLMIGLFLVLAYPVQKRMIAAGTYPMGEIKEREDGKKEEVLEGNYLPFGPSLALAALLVVIYDPAIRSLAVWWMVRIFPPLPYQLPFL